MNPLDDDALQELIFLSPEEAYHLAVLSYGWRSYNQQEAEFLFYKKPFLVEMDLFS